MRDCVPINSLPKHSTLNLPPSHDRGLFFWFYEDRGVSPHAFNAYQETTERLNLGIRVAAMENLIFAAVIGLTVYLFMRRLKNMKAQKRRQVEEAASGEPPEEPGSMPRLGSPGSITREQIKLLKENDFEPSRLWSTEEAKLILDAVTYQRAVIYMTTGEADPPIEVQNQLMKIILSDDELREHVYEWGLNRTRDEDSAPQPVLERNEFFALIEAAVLELWETS